MALQTPKSLPLTIINPNAFTTLGEIKARFLKDSILETIGSNMFEIVSGLTNVVNAVAPKVGTIIGNIAQEIYKQNGLFEDNLAYFRFRINPNKLSVSNKKILSTKYTGSGYDIDTRGNELIQYKYTGTSGSLVPYNFFDSVGIPMLKQLFEVLNIGASIAGASERFPELSSNPKLSEAYLKFLLFDLFWRYNNDDLLVFWEDNCYVGKLNSFNFNLDANNPYQIIWDFDLQVYPDFVYNVYTGWISEADFSNIKNTFNRGVPTNNVTFSSDIAGQSQNEDLVTWFSTLGQYPYNKDKIQFFKNMSLNLSTDISSITPINMAKYYKAIKNIDIFEENSSFNLRTNIINIATQESINNNNNNQEITNDEFTTEKEFQFEIPEGQ